MFSPGEAVPGCRVMLRRLVRSEEVAVGLAVRAKAFLPHDRRPVNPLPGYRVDDSSDEQAADESTEPGPGRLGLLVSEVLSQGQLDGPPRFPLLIHSPLVGGNFADQGLHLSVPLFVAVPPVGRLGLLGLECGLQLLGVLGLPDEGRLVEPIGPRG